MVKKYFLFLIVCNLITSPFLFNSKASALDKIVFPILGDARYGNDFNSPRASGNHNATDIFANKMHGVVSATDGTITYVAYPEPSWGYMVTVTDAQGYKYEYIHLNNDRPGTDDGMGGPTNAYAPDMKTGNKIVKGQHIGYVGDSGNAESTPPHLHFEITGPSGNAVNPYPYLQNADIYQNAVSYPALSSEFLPYGDQFYGNGSISSGNFDQDATMELVTGAGRGGGPHVKVFESDGTPAAYGFLAYDDGFRGGIDVAAGDIDGDGVDEIITGAGPTGGPHVKVFESDGTPAAYGFLAYDDGFRGGINVAAGDIDGDGIDEIITGARAGGGPHVKAFKPNGQMVSSFFPYNVEFSGGVDVTSANVTGDTKDEIIAAAGPSGGPHVTVYSGNGQWLSGFFAYASEFRGGVRVSANNVRTSTPYAEIVTLPHSMGGPEMKIFTSSGSALNVRSVLENWWEGSYDVAAGNGQSTFSTGGNRRASIRPGIN